MDVLFENFLPVARGKDGDLERLRMAEFLAAAQQADVRKMQTLCGMGHNIHVRDQRGLNALMMAAVSRQAMMAKWCCASALGRRDLNHVEPRYSCSALIMACSWFPGPGCSTTRSRELSPALIVGGFPGLVWSLCPSAIDNPACLRILVHAGTCATDAGKDILRRQCRIDLLAADCEGNNAMHWAVASGCMRILCYLCMLHEYHGPHLHAAVQALLQGCNSAGETPLALATRLNASALVPILDRAVSISGVLHYSVF
jgi:hypothetical protein